MRRRADFWKWVFDPEDGRHRSTIAITVVVIALVYMLIEIWRRFD
jgi:hypothetical protein